MCACVCDCVCVHAHMRACVHACVLLTAANLKPNKVSFFSLGRVLCLKLLCFLLVFQRNMQMIEIMHAVCMYSFREIKIVLSGRQKQYQPNLSLIN